PAEGVDGPRPALAPVIQPGEEESPMVGPWYPRTAACGAYTVDTWYATTTDGDTAVITLPDPPRIWLIHRSPAPGHRRTAGARGLTLALADACQRLTMVQACGRHARRWQERAPGAGQVHPRRRGDIADRSIPSHQRPQTVRA